MKVLNAEVNHIADLGEGIIIIIKDVPAEVCKQCGESYVDTQIALTLESIIEEVRKNSPLPLVNDLNIVLDSYNKAICIIETTKVYTTLFKEVLEEHAFKEGEEFKVVFK